MTHSQNGHLSLLGARVAMILTLILGIWLYISPWVFVSYTSPDAWNSAVIGGLIATLAAIRLNNPRRKEWMIWVNLALGIWIIVSPWAYGYVGDPARFVNSLCVGGAICILAILGGGLTVSRHSY